MADTSTSTSSPAVGRRRFLATAAAAALLVTDRIPGAWAVPRAATDDPFTLGVASATRPRSGWCSGPDWRHGRSTGRRHAGAGRAGRRGGGGGDEGHSRPVTYGTACLVGEPDTRR
jgi:hypothetical protein